VKTGKKEDDRIDHERTSRSPTALAAKSPAPVPLTEVVPLDAVRSGLGLNQEIRGKQSGARFPSN
jgi:hypothetical protein